MPPPTPDCERESTVGAYHDGELSDADRQEFERHLSSCPACAAELRRVRAVSRWMEPLRRAKLSPVEKDDLARSTARAAAEEDAAASDRMRMPAGAAVRWARWVTAAAAAVFLFSVVQLFRGQQVTPRPTPGGPGGVPAMQRTTTAPVANPGPRDSQDAPAGGRGGAQPDSKKLTEQQ
jgi:anti-sigma factor RsiW